MTHHELSGDDLADLQELASKHPNNFMCVDKVMRNGKVCASSWKWVVAEMNTNRSGPWRATTQSGMRLTLGSLLQCVRATVAATPPAMLSAFGATTGPSCEQQIMAAAAAGETADGEPAVQSEHEAPVAATAAAPAAAPAAATAAPSAGL